MGLDVLKLALDLAGIDVKDLDGEMKTKATLYAIEHFADAARDDAELEPLVKLVAKKLGCTMARARQVFGEIGDAAGELK